MRSSTRARRKHFLVLVPLGAAVGTVTGAIFRDPLFGLAAGVILALLLAGLFALRGR